MIPKSSVKKIFSGNTIRKILKDNGAKEISDESIDLLNKIITKISYEIAMGAVKLTRFKGYKTIKNDAIKVSTQQFLDRKLENLELKLFEKSKIRDILKDNGAERISKEVIEFMNKIISKISEDIALGAVEIAFSNKNEIIQKEAIRLSTKQFLGIDLDNKKNNFLEGK